MCIFSKYCRGQLIFSSEFEPNLKTEEGSAFFRRFPADFPRNFADQIINFDQFANLLRERVEIIQEEINTGMINSYNSAILLVNQNLFKLLFRYLLYYDGRNTNGLASLKTFSSDIFRKIREKKLLRFWGQMFGPRVLSGFTSRSSGINDPTRERRKLSNKICNPFQAHLGT